MRHSLLLLLACFVVTILALACGDDSTMTTDSGTDTSVTDTGTPDTSVGDSAPVDSTTDGGACVVTPPGNERTWGECTDGVDNDCDGEIDVDLGCSICPPFSAPESGTEDTEATCGDGIDNDCDGRADCSETSCRDLAGCADEADDETLCSDGVDNDGDGRIDCGERSCASTMACRPATMAAAEDDATLCGNGLDDDYDGFIDCDDNDCDAVGFCGPENADAACSDGNDNDGDGHIDCRDSGCSDVLACMGEDGDAACTNGTDDDGDGDVDCRDRDCIGLPVCVDLESNCDDMMDDDRDGATDCLDDDCATECAADPCSATNWFGTCAGTLSCAMGVCARPLSDFDLTTEQPLLITEIMPNPFTVSDGDGEFVEVTNVTTSFIDVEGLVFSDDDPTNTAEVVGPLLIAPGESMVFVANDDPDANGGITNGVAFGFGLNQDGDDAAIAYMGTEIHRVTYPGSGNDLTNTGTSATEAQSIQLDRDFLEGTTSTPNWCLTEDVPANAYFTDPGDGDADYGTPGAPNLICP